MSLTREIDTPGSPIARFFTEGFPHVQRLDERWASEAGQASTLRPRARGAVDWPMLGTAFGHRVHFAFSRRAPAAVTAGAARIVLDDDPDLEHRLRLRVQAGSGRLTPEDPPPVGVEAFLGRLGDFLQRHQPDGGGGAPAAVLEPVVERRFAQACWGDGAAGEPLPGRPRDRRGVATAVRRGSHHRVPARPRPRVCDR